MSVLRVPQKDKKQLARFLGERSCFDPDEPFSTQNLLDSMLFQPSTQKPSLLQEMKQEPVPKEKRQGQQALESAKIQPMILPIELWENEQTTSIWVRQTNMPKIIPRV